MELELKQKIHEFEREAGESFTDRFMHDKVKDASWAFWLLGKGYKSRANVIIQAILDGERCIDQDILYDIHGAESEDAESWDEESYGKNTLLWAEFLAGTPYYLEKVLAFLAENNLAIEKPNH